MGDEEDSEKKTATSNQQQRISDSSISKLSRDVVMVIFCKLPVESLMYCRCVCQAWRNLILDPVFGRLHLTTAPSILIFQFGGFWKLISTHMVEPETCYHDAITKDNIGFYIPKLNGMRIVGSCNGLLCLYGDRGDFFHISNPITGEFMSLPKTLTEWENNFVPGFGFSSMTNQYKVIRMQYRHICYSLWEVEIYTVGSGTWRNIGYAPYYSYFSIPGIFLNGALHWIAWIAHDNNRSILICAFDIGNEQFQTIPLPPVSCSKRGHKTYWSNLGVLGGCLYICVDQGYYSTSPSIIEIWVMKEYGVKESWTKELVIKDSTAHFSYGDIWLQLIQHSRNDESLMLSCRNNLISYNPRTGSLRKLYGNQSGIEVFPHTPSILSLENIVMGDSSKVFNVPRRYKICCS